MPQALGAKIGRTFTYRTAAGKLRSCVVTAVTSQTVVDLRESRGSTTTYLAKSRRTTPTGATANDKWSAG